MLRYLALSVSAGLLTMLLVLWMSSLVDRLGETVIECTVVKP